VRKEKIMSKNIITFITLLSGIVGIACLMLVFVFNGTTLGGTIKYFLFLYWSFVTLGFFVAMLNYDNIDFRKDAFFIHPFFLFVPGANVIVALGYTGIAITVPLDYIGIAIAHSIKHKGKKAFIKEKNRMTKRYPQLVSLNALKEIYEIINVKTNLRQALLVEKPMTGDDLKRLIIFLENNYLHDEYSNLLSNYEFTFIKLISIYKENIAIENLISSDIFMSSKKILEQFSDKVQDAKNNIEKNKLLEKEMNNSIEIQTRDITKQRLLNEINEEFKFHEVNVNMI
jgi:hypothetical protein